MNWLDIVIIVLFTVLGLIGWKVGIIRAVVTLGGVVAGIVLAGQFYGALADLLGGFISSPNAASVAAFFIILMATVLAAIILGRVIRSFLKLLLMGWVDGVAGAAVGVVVAALLGGGLVAVLSAFSFAGLDRAVEGSLLGPLLRDKIGVVLALLPREFDRARQMLPLS
ncbi:MAG: CvpA family protein [Chloroflexi bacterium]|nr:CvpA family protein [Chloroflexota bacterium]